MQFLLELFGGIFSDLEQVKQTDFCVVVYDRFQGRSLYDVSGESFDLPDPDPVRIAPFARSTCPSETKHCQVLLYCNTHNDASGYHYEWITRGARQSGGLDKQTIEAPAVAGKETSPIGQNLAQTPWEGNKGSPRTNPQCQARGTEILRSGMDLWTKHW